MAIRQPPSDIKDPNLRGFLQELRNAIGGVTAQVSTLARSIQVINGGGTTPTTPTNPTDPTNPTNPTPGGDGYPPPPPLSLTATADVWAINLAWENPVIADYLGTEIWAKRTFPTWSSSTRYYVNAKVLYSGVVYRAKKGNDATGGAAVDNTNHVPTDTTWWEATTLTVMADRVLVTEVAGSSYTFTGLTSELLTPGETWAFWVRNHDIENLFSTYFPDNDQGVSATTLLDPGAMIDLLTGAIKETELYKDLGDRIDLIDVDIPGRQSLVTITTELDNGLTTTNGIVAKKVATFRQGTQPTSTSTYTLVAGDIWINTADQNKAYRYNGSGWDRIDNTQIDATAASVLNKEEAKIGYCSISPNTYLTKATCVAAGGNWIDQPFATKVTQVGVTASDGTTATVQQQMESIYGPGGLRSQYTVKIDNNGYVSGFGLASTPVNGTPYSDFIIRVDRFSIAQPASPDAGYQSDATIPFIVTTGSTTINGETVPAGTYIKDAYIQNGTITSAKIGSLDADKITSGSIDADRLQANVISAVNASIQEIDANRISTTNLSAKLAQITEAYIDTANITDAAITNAKIQDGEITNAKIGSVINSTNFNGSIVNGSISTLGTAGWAIDKAGQAVFNSGTFRGTLDVKSATSGARLEMKNNVIKVFDENGVLRVKIGDLSA